MHNGDNASHWGRIICVLILHLPKSYIFVPADDDLFVQHYEQINEGINQRNFLPSRRYNAGIKMYVRKSQFQPIRQMGLCKCVFIMELYYLYGMNTWLNQICKVSNKMFFIGNLWIPQAFQLHLYCDKNTCNSLEAMSLEHWPSSIIFQSEYISVSVKIQCDNQNEEHVMTSVISNIRKMKI